MYLTEISVEIYNILYIHLYCNFQSSQMPALSLSQLKFKMASLE